MKNLKKIDVDDCVYSELDVSHRKMLLSPILPRHLKTAKIVFAIVGNDVLDFLLFIELLREIGASVFLIHPETPVATCKELAQEAGCSFLIYNRELIALKHGDEYDQPSLVQMSSGTTGRPKRIVRSWKSVEDEIFQYNLLLDSKDEKPVVLVPASHSYGLIAGILSANERGDFAHVVTSKNPKYLMKCVASHPRHLVYAVPFQIHLIRSLNEKFVFHKVMTSGAALNHQLFETLRGSGAYLMQQYGCTEVGCISLAHQPRYVHDVGIPLKHLKVHAGASRDQATEVIVQSQGNEVSTRDLGYFDEQGSLQILNRIDDLINVSGQKVTPFEVESVIGRLAGVRESVVYASSHKIWGECVSALVVSDIPRQVMEVKNFCMEHLAPYKIPVKIRMVDAIPRTERGKISRIMLRQMEDSRE